MASFTQKHFVTLADVAVDVLIKAETESADVEHGALLMVYGIAKQMRRENPKFDIERFADYIVSRVASDGLTRVTLRTLIVKNGR